MLGFPWISMTHHGTFGWTIVKTLSRYLHDAVVGMKWLCHDNVMTRCCLLSRQSLGLDHTALTPVWNWRGAPLQSGTYCTT